MIIELADAHPPKTGTGLSTVTASDADQGAPRCHLIPVLGSSS